MESERMASKRSPHDHIVAATALLDLARAADQPGRAVQALAECARAAEAFDWKLDRPEAAETAAELRDFAAGDAALLGWAVLTVTNGLYGDDPDGVVEALLARSGFQVLLDLGVWEECPVDAGHLADVDDELAEAVEERRLDDGPLERPVTIPTHHTWWIPPPPA
jgi:hypothetical protein